MKFIIQKEETGCGIASVANIVEKTYEEVKTLANSIGIFAEDEKLYSDTQYVRTLLDHYGYQTHSQEIPFTSFKDLPNLALLSIKYNEENGIPSWHWVVFKRIDQKEYILDSSSSLKENLIKDFTNIQPKWFIEVYEKSHRSPKVFNNS